MNITPLLMGWAQEIYTVLGTGHDEAVYQKALEVELRAEGYSCDVERVVPIMYKGCFVGYGRSDIVMHSHPADTVIELKAQYSKLGPREEAQLRKYLQGLGLACGYVLNFPQPGSGSRSLERVEMVAVTLETR